MVDNSKGPAAQPAHTETGRSAFLVASGIFLSRLAGLVRESAIAGFFGISPVADAFRAAMRIPNFLSNLFGEGVLSASFIPVYAKLIAQDDEQEAGRVAGVILSLLALVTSVMVLLGVFATPYFIDVIAGGFKGQTRELAIHLVKIFFPAAGLMVLSAWCLGVLNSHRKFFLSYVSPVIWNAAIIVALLAFGRHTEIPRLAAYAAWGSVVGSALQFFIQLPIVLRLVPKLRLTLSIANQNVRMVIRNFGPVFVSRGVVQLSGYIDTFLASYLPAGALAALSNAQNLYLLPIGLFGMSVSVAELPAMSSTLGNEQEIAAALGRRIESSTRRIGFFVVPSAIAFLALGDVVAGAIFQVGRFTHSDAIYVWGILAGSAVGLVASTVGRLYNSAYYALRDTRTPLRFAIVRVTLTTVLGFLFAWPLPHLLGIDLRWGAAGLTASAGIAAWIEFLLLRSGMERRIGRIPAPAVYLAKLWLCAVVGAAAGWGVKLWLHPSNPRLAAVLILIPYGLVYLGLTAAIGIDQTQNLLRRFKRAK
ncbi:MAG: murein biosynthesis integral membrane protein MurJ [Candidatus Angelobacter sp. Gp1-AA117]|nr:MAG: murein biosynthesis integral membrane protein MurJ [Candidatus Angelobacter sp. Gp1-AA117]